MESQQQTQQQDRDQALRQAQIELIEEDIKMHEETGDRSPLEGAVEHLERIDNEKEEVPEEVPEVQAPAEEVPAKPEIKAKKVAHKKATHK